MNKIKLSGVKLAKVQNVCSKLEDLAEVLGVTLEGSSFEDDINELAEKIRNSFN